MNTWRELKLTLSEQSNDPSDEPAAELFERYAATRASGDLLATSTLSYQIGIARMRRKVARLFGHELSDSELRALIDDPPRELFPKAFERRAAARNEEQRMIAGIRGTESQRLQAEQRSRCVDPRYEKRGGEQR